MSPLLTAQDTAVTAISRTVGVRPDVSTALTFINEAIPAAPAEGAAGRGFRVRAAAAAGAFRFDPAASTVVAGRAITAVVAIPARHTSTQMSSLTTRPFNLVDLTDVIGADTHIKKPSARPQAEPYRISKE